VSAGNSHSLALKANGEVWSWGSNSLGQLGDNTLLLTEHKSSPISVVGGHSFIEIAAGGSYSLALKANGEVWAWGGNASGQLGINLPTSSHQSSPISVAGGHSFTKIVTGTSATLALKANGEVWAWGNNTSAQLGDASVTSRSSPVSVVDGHSFIDISISSAHSLALKANGEVWAWGDNGSGKMGLGYIAFTYSHPIQMAGLGEPNLKDYLQARGGNITLPVTAGATVAIRFTQTRLETAISVGGIFVGFGNRVTLSWI
jgi:alpha-tubulin suppressor-like RCC1 family protein